MTETGAVPPPTPAPAAAAAGRAPKAWLPHSILALFLFLPTGIVALVYSLRSRSRWAAGDAPAARVAATKARTWSLGTIVLGGALLGLLLIMGLVYGSADLNNYP